MNGIFSATNPLPLILLGTGGHAKVVVALLQALGRRIAGVCDPSLAAAGTQEWRGFALLGDDSDLARYAPDDYELAMGIGISPGSNLRSERYKTFTALGYRFPTLIHPGALIDKSVVVAEGAQVMAGVIVQPDVQIGYNTILNTGARIDHDCYIGDHVHIAPGALLCGGVCVSDETFIGASATLLPLVKTGRCCFVAAGSTLARDLTDGEFFAPHRLTDPASALLTHSSD
jgi:sugar O-acyltransferase (sialic acid O-acetyltransferase NeuD family)